MLDLRERVASPRYDAIVVGSGPNGLAAAITLAEANWSVLVLEAEDTVGGGMRSAELTLPGFRHDICAAIHPLGLGSPFFRSLDLSRLGVRWARPSVQYAQPMDREPAVLAARSLGQTAAGLGRDSGPYLRLMAPLVAAWPDLLEMILAPARIPRHPVIASRFAVNALRSASSLVGSWFTGARARALFGGIAAHSQMRLEYPTTAGTALLLAALAHGVGWPVAVGGTQSIADALAAHLSLLGGEIVTNARVDSLRELPPAQRVLLDVTPRQFVTLAGDRLRGLYRRQLQHYRYGPGSFKLDYALAGPVPWTDPEISAAGTVHLGGTFDEIAGAEAEVASGRHPERPFVLAAQQSLFDVTRAPAGKHTLWAYCHVPNGSNMDMTDRIERQIERFAPGFRDLVLARHVTTPAAFQVHNANYIGGDINAGALDIRQIYTRPAVRLDPYSTPIPGVYLCSASTPPAGGVHGMCGYWAARSALGF